MPDFGQFNIRTSDYKEEKPDPKDLEYCERCGMHYGSCEYCAFR